MKKLTSLIRNYDHDLEDEYRDPFDGRRTGWLVLIIILVIGLVFLGLYLLTHYVRAL